MDDPAMGGEVRRALKKNETGFGTPTIKGNIHYDEKYLNVKGKNHFDLNAIDSKTKFVLSELFVEKRTFYACKAFLKKIKEWCYPQILERYRREKTKSRKQRRLITFVSDKFCNYKTAWRKLFFRVTTLRFGVPIACRKYRVEHNNNPIERHNREIKRNNIARGPFQSITGASSTRALQRMVHNYITPHQTLKGRTPAQAANMRLQLGENRLYYLIKLAKKVEMTIR